MINSELQNQYYQLLAYKKLKVQQGENTSLVDKLILQTKKAGNFDDDTISYSDPPIEEAHLLAKEIQQFVKEQ